jgi:hypothetical protein
MRTTPFAALVGAAFLPLLAGCGGGGGGSEAAAQVEVVTESLASGQTGAEYDQQVVATFSNDPGTYLVAGGALPTGLRLDPQTGVISGVPRDVGTFRFRIAAQDGPDASLPKDRDATFAQASREFTVQVSRGPPQILSRVMPGAQFRVPYGAQIDAAGGTKPYTFQQVGGSLPAGLTVSPTGFLGSFPQEANQHPYRFLVRLTDADGNTDTEELEVDVIVLPLLIATVNLPQAAQGFPYDAAIELASAGGGGPYTWSQVPPAPGETLLSSIGLEIAANGHVRNAAGSDGPTAPGDFTFTIRVADQAGQFASRQFSLRVNPGPTISSISPNSSAKPGPYTVTGLNFQSGAVLIFDPDGAAVQISPQFISSTQLRFANAPVMPTGGSKTVRVRNPDLGFDDLENGFLYPFDNLSFGQKGFLASAISSTGLAAGDLNGDGLAEVVHSGASGFRPYLTPAGSSVSTAGGLHLLVNTGGLSFTPILLDAASYYDVNIFDANVDGHPDIVALAANAIRAFLNDGNGNFGSPVSSPLPNDGNFQYPSEMTFGFLNSDSVPDVAFGVAHWANVSGRCYTAIGNGLGGYSIVGQAVSTLTNIYGINSLATFKNDGDARHELAVSGGWNNSAGPVFRWATLTTTGDFAGWTSSANANSSYSNTLGVGAGNFLGNGSPAVVTVHTQDPGDGNAKQVKLWHGPGLTTGVVLQTPTGAGKCIGVGDLDLDGIDDFAVSSNLPTTSSGTPTGEGRLDVYRGSSMTIVQTMNLITGSPTVSSARAGRVAVGDLDGDGRPDLLVTTSYWATDAQPPYWGTTWSLRLAGDGNPMGVVYYLNSSN